MYILYMGNSRSQRLSGNDHGDGDDDDDGNDDGNDDSIHGRLRSILYTLHGNVWETTVHT